MEVVLRLWRAPLVRAVSRSSVGSPHVQRTTSGGVVRQGCGDRRVCAREGGVRGSTEPAPDEGSPCRLAEASSRPRPRRRRPLGARARRSRDRDGGAARPGARPRAHEFQAIALVLRDERARVRADDTMHRRAARRAAQAPRRHRDAPRQDRRPGCRAPGAARRGRQSSPTRRARSSGRCSATRGHRDGRRGGAGRRRSAAAPPPSPASCRSRWSRGSWPTPSSPPTSRPPGRPRPGRTPLATWELLGPLLQLVRARRRRSLGVHGAARARSRRRAGRPGADAAPGPAGRRGRGRPPDLPARRRAGAGQDGPGAARRGGGERLPAARRRAERRQDELGCARPACGRRAARPP